MSSSDQLQESEVSSLGTKSILPEEHLLISLTQVLGRGIWSRCCNSRCDSSSWSRASLAASYRSSCR